MANSESFFVRPRMRLRNVLLGSVVLIAGFLTLCAWLAQGPDRAVSFGREAISRQDLELIDRRLSSVAEWKKWFHTMEDVQVVNEQKQPLAEAEQRARPGALVLFSADTRKGRRKKFQMLGRITRYEPQKALEIEVLEDSSGKLFRMFDRIHWKIEVEPLTEGARIQGTETAHTAHWRARLFTRISHRVLMHQIFYPNLLALADPNAAARTE